MINLTNSVNLEVVAIVFANVLGLSFPGTAHCLSGVRGWKYLQNVVKKSPCPVKKE